MPTATRLLNRVLLTLCLCAPACAVMALPDLNGTWTLDEDASENLEDAGRAFNRELNERRRRNTKQRFDLSERQSPGGNKYEKQAFATERMIREDHRSHDWDLPDDVRVLVDAETVKLYQGRKVAVLYNGETRRLLTINPAGRAYSVSGTTITADDYGRSLTYIEADSIVVETDLNTGDRIVERFEPGDGPNRMLVRIRLQRGSRGPWLEFARNYDRID